MKKTMTATIDVSFLDICTEYEFNPFGPLDALDFSRWGQRSCSHNVHRIVSQGRMGECRVGIERWSHGAGRFPLPNHIPYTAHSPTSSSHPHPIPTHPILYCTILSISNRSHSNVGSHTWDQTWDSPWTGVPQSIGTPLDELGNVP